VRLPIRARITLWYAVLLAAVVAGVGLFLVLQLRADLTAAVDRGLHPAAAQIADGYRAEGAPEAVDVARSVLTGERPAAQILDPSGRVAVAWGDPVARAPMLTRAAAAAVLRDGELTRTVALGRGDQRFRLVARPTVRRGRRQVAVAVESMATVDRSVRGVVVLLLVAGPAALLATALGGWWLARRALRPIDRMTARAAAIDLDRIDERLVVPPTGDEVAHLATTLNAMLDRIERGVEEQHRLVADASHELRTPLAAMRAEIDVSLRADDLAPAARRVLDSTREEVDRMARTVDDLLVLASLDEGRLALLVEPLDLHDVASRAALALESLAAARGVSLVVDGPAAPAAGDPDRLEHAVRNLIENAIKFSPEGAEVAIATWAAGGEVGVTVRDQGPGVEPAIRERIFDRFFRADPSRTRATGGSGLGLAICREIVAAHGGRVWVEDADAAASAFSLALPAAAPATPGASAGGAGAQNASGAAGSCAMSPENLPGIAVDRYLVPHEHKPSGVAP
jgi:heavy metal sensor kinase